MMKKKVKKMPKYYNGELAVGMPDMSNYKIQNRMGVAPPSSSSTISYSGNENWADMTSNQKSAAVANVIGGGADLINMATSGQKVTAGTALGGIAKGASAGAAFGPVGAIVGGAAGLIAGTAGSTNKVNYDTASTNINDIKLKGSGWVKLFGMSDEEMNRKANLVQNNNIGRIQTEQMRAKYAMNPYNPNGEMVMAAEGGIMNDYVMAAVSPGELEIDPVTLQYVEYPGDKGKPNSKDNIKKPIKAGKMIASNAAHMKMDNDKTPADNAKMILDSKMPEEMKRKMIKKLFNWLEANKTKPQEYAKFSTGTSNVKSADDVSFDKDMYVQMLSMLPMINRTNFEKYNKMQNDYALLGFADTKPGDNLKKNDKVTAYLKLYDELTFGNERIDQMRKEGRIKGKGGSADKAKTWNDGLPGTQTWLRHLGKNLSTEQINEINSLLSQQGLEAYINDNGMVNYRRLNKPVSHAVTNPKIEVEDEIIDEAQIPDYDKWVADPQKQYNKGLRKLRLQKMRNSLGELGKAAFDIAPMAAALFGDYDYHTESSQITPPRFVPVNADPRPLLRAADESLAMARYNQANISPNTGAGMAYGLQAASNRAKAYADAYQWQQETNNKLIAQNAGIYNDWRKQHDAYATQAIADTRANEGAAQQMKDQARKDRLEFYYGKRNDDMLTAMLEPMFEYGTPDKAYRLIYKRRIV